MHRPGRLLADRYRLVDRVGAGAIGEVWRATDESLGRTVAVKVMREELLADAHAVRRFRAEALAMGRIDHPGVVRVHDVQLDGDGAFLVMEYVAGEPLSERLRRAGRLPPATTMELVAQAAEALQAVHEQGIVHRDVKPSNLLLPDPDTVRLTDFGIARVRDLTQITATAKLLGTPSYLAPEQAQGKPASMLSDVYSLGVVAYECLAGRRPFDRDNPYATAMARVHDPPPTLVGDIPPQVCVVVEHALEREPERRWPSAAEFATACRRVAGSPRAVPTEPATDRPAPQRKQRKSSGKAGTFRAAIDPAAPPADRLRLRLARSRQDAGYQEWPAKVVESWFTGGGCVVLPATGVLLCAGGLAARHAGATEAGSRDASRRR